MAAVRIWLLVTVSSSSVIVACAGESRHGERDADEHVGGATTGGAQPDTGGTSSAGGAGTGGNSGESGTSGVGGGGTGGGGVSSGGAGMGGMPGGSGGSGAGVNASCDNVMPCGGDVVGTWTVIDSCLNVSGDLVGLLDLGLGCMAAPTTGSLEVIGTWSASSEGMMVSDDTTTSGDASIEVPEECAVTSSQPIRCANLAGPVAFLGYASLACVDSESAWCACSGTFEQSGGMGLISTSPITSGTYTTADGVLTVSDGTSRAEYFYCSSENSMILSLKSVANTGAVTGTIVLQKQ